MQCCNMVLWIFIFGKQLPGHLRFLKGLFLWSNYCAFLWEWWWKKLPVTTYLWSGRLSLAVFTSWNGLYLLYLWHRMLLLKMLRYCGLRSSADYVVQVDSQPLSEGSGWHLSLRSSVVCAFEHGTIAVLIQFYHGFTSSRSCVLWSL